MWLTAGQRNRKEGFYQPQFTRVLTDHHIVESNAGMFPLMVNPEGDKAPLYQSKHDSLQPNLADAATKFLNRLSCKPEDIFYSTLTTLNSVQYSTENTGALRQDWPRIPLPGSQQLLFASAQLGRQVSSLFDTESPVKGVTSAIFALNSDSSELPCTSGR